MIETLQPCDDGWFSEQWTYFESKKDYIQAEVLGFCLCGDPDETMEYVYAMLRRMERREWASSVDQAYMFFVYWATKQGFLEHGTTARCSWLTDRGKELLRDIDAVREEQ